MKRCVRRPPGWRGGTAAAAAAATAVVQGEGDGDVVVLVAASDATPLLPCGRRDNGWWIPVAAPPETQHTTIAVTGDEA